MLKDKQYFKVSAVIFLAVAILHAFRVLNGWDAQIGDYEVPMWVSYVVVVVGGYLAYHGFTAKK